MSQPSSASAKAIARPRRRAAPVTSATLFLRGVARDTIVSLPPALSYSENEELAAIPRADGAPARSEMTKVRYSRDGSRQRWICRRDLHLRSNHDLRDRSRLNAKSSGKLPALSLLNQQSCARSARR